MQVGLLTEIMNAFVDAFSGGFDRIRPAIGSLLHLLIGIEVAWFGVLFLLGMESVSGGLRKLMTIGLWSFVALHFDEHALALVDSLVRAGLLAAGSEGQSARTLLNPSRIFEDAFTATQPLADQVLKGSLLSINGTYIMFGLTYVLMMVAFAALAINAFMVLIEYYLAIAVVGILMPFGVLRSTRWIATKPTSYFLSCGLKMMVISFLVAISRTVLAKIHFSGSEPTLREMWIALCCTVMIGLLCWKAPDRMAQGFMAGAASFGGADPVHHAKSVGAGVAVAGGAIGGAALAMGKAAYKGYQKLREGSEAPKGGGPSWTAPAAAGGSAAQSVAFTASASGRGAAAGKPPVLVPPTPAPRSDADRADVASEPA